MSDRVLILLWHNVEGTWYHPSRPGAGIRGLTRQLKRLKQLGTIVPLGSALEALSADEPLPPRAIALTFDDGYQDHLDLAVPLLQELDLPATFFLIPGILSREVHPWWEVLGWAFICSSRTEVTFGGRRLPTVGRGGRASFLWTTEYLKTLDRGGLECALQKLLGLLRPEGRPDHHKLFLDWDGARQLVRQGFGIGSHSMYHTVLSRETRDEQLNNLVASRARLQAELGVSADLLAYPSGTRADYDMNTIDAARRAGHAYGLAAHAGLHARGTSPYAVPRFVMVSDQGFPEILAKRALLRLKAPWRVSP